MMHYEGWTFVQAWYWFCVTGTTVGYGDYSPGTDQGKMFAFFYLPICTPLVSALLIKFFSWVFSYGAAAKHDHIMDDDLTADMISQMDKDGDNQVTREEWLGAMLVRLHYVDASVIEKIAERYTKLDTSGDGKLSLEDLLYPNGLPDKIKKAKSFVRGGGGDDDSTVVIDDSMVAESNA